MTAIPGEKQVYLAWDPVDGASSYTVLRSTYAEGPFTAIVPGVTTSTYTNIGLEYGRTYYYVVQAANSSGFSAYSNQAVAVTPSLNAIMEVAIAENTVKVGQEFIGNIILRDVSGIYAEDFSIQYNDSMLEFQGFEEIPGYKVYYAVNHSDGNLRFIVASQGAEYGIHSDTVFLKLKFKAKAVGTGRIDISKGRIADTTAEYDLDLFHRVSGFVGIQNYDVNLSGEYTLVDLAIDAAHFGQLGSSLDPTQYAANQVGDDMIRDEDLTYIVYKMLSNRNYAPNN